HPLHDLYRKNHSMLPLTFSGTMTTSVFKSIGLNVSSIHSSQNSKCFLSIQCSKSSTSFPPSPCTEYQYKNSSSSRYSLKIVSTYIFSPSRVIRTSFILSFKNFTHSSTSSDLPFLSLNLVNSTFNLLSPRF